MGVYYVNGPKQTITVQQALQYAQQAGFSGTALINAVAIAMAESGLSPNSANTTTSGVGIDRGIVKFNSVFHKEVPDACAYDPACAFREMYRVSQGGTNFNAWCTYNLGCANPPNSNGPYRANVATVTAAAQGLPNVSTANTATSGAGLLGIDFKSYGEHIAVFVLAVFFVIAGFYLMNQQAINKAVGNGVDAAIKLTI